MDTPAHLQPVFLVTGGHGLLGSRLVSSLAEHVPGARIIATARRDEPVRWKSANVEAMYGDLRDESLWARFPGEITHVFHTAAVIPWKAEEKYNARLVPDNLLPLGHLIEQSQRWPHLQQVVYTSSISVYAQQAGVPLREDSAQRPANLYGAAKLAGEAFLSCLEARGVGTVALRLSSLYAAGQYEGTVLPIMVRRALNNQGLLIFGDGTRTQDFLHCADAVRAMMLCFQKGARGVYNIGTGRPVTMTELAQTVSRVFADGGAKITYEQARPGDDPGIMLDISKARSELGFEPHIRLESGLRMLKQEMEEIKR
jgi:UDP-glucose 4-epimerase